MELTAFEGDDQQCNAAPAWTASIEPEEKGSLDTSALTRARLLWTFNYSIISYYSQFFLIRTQDTRYQTEALACQGFMKPTFRILLTESYKVN